MNQIFVCVSGCLYLKMLDYSSSIQDYMNFIYKKRCLINKMKSPSFTLQKYFICAFIWQFSWSLSCYSHCTLVFS